MKKEKADPGPSEKDYNQTTGKKPQARGERFNKSLACFYNAL